MIIYVVGKGDSLYEIARKYNVSVDDISYINMLENPERLVVGQSLIIPIKSYMHTVQSGESIYGIAKMYQVSVNEILKTNPNITNPGLIYPGEKINIPTDNRNKKRIDVNGYAYTNIVDTTLDNSLQNLTYISPFSYEVKNDGTIRNLNDEVIRTKAITTNTLPILVITNIKESGGFDSKTANEILTNQEVQNELLDNIEDMLESKGFAGLNVDFEYIYPENKNDYNIFLQKLADRIKSKNYLLFTSVAPKIGGNQAGTLYEAHDYAFHGKVADGVIIMTYEWGYTYGPPMAVAPLNQVKRVLEYAITTIPKEKILMGMPNYGYDWKLPYQKGTAAKAISNLTALNIAIRNNSEIKFDSVASAPYFKYFSDGTEHIVWFDDARSFEARFELIEEYGLAGTSIWTINNFFRPMFVVLTSQYDVKKR